MFCIILHESYKSILHIIITKLKPIGPKKLALNAAQSPHFYGNFAAISPHNLTIFAALCRTIRLFEQVRHRIICDFWPHLNVASEEEPSEKRRKGLHCSSNPDKKLRFCECWSDVALITAAYFLESYRRVRKLMQSDNTHEIRDDIEIVYIPLDSIKFRRAPRGRWRVPKYVIIATPVKRTDISSRVIYGH